MKNMRMKDVFLSRRSVYNFREDFKMNEEDFKSMFELARYNPSIYNTQPVRYLVTTDKEKQAKLKEICYNQHKIYSASGVILVLSKKDFLNKSNVAEIYQPSVDLGLMDEDDFNFIKTQVESMKNNLTEEEMKDEMYRNTFLSVGILISIATIFGYDTCPMHAQNTEEIRKLFNIPEDLEVMFMIPIGKAVDKERPRGYRHHIDELVKFEGF